MGVFRSLGIVGIFNQIFFSEKRVFSGAFACVEFYFREFLWVPVGKKVNNYGNI